MQIKNTFFVLFLAFLVIFTGLYIYFWNFYEFSNLLEVKSLTGFAKSSGFVGKRTERLELECDFFALGCEGHEHFVSPYFPHIALSSYIAVDEDDKSERFGQPSRWIAITYDPLWRIFWVRNEENYTSEGTYGSFRSRNLPWF